MMSSLSLHAASLSTNNTGLELLQLVSEIYKTQPHWGTKCGHGLCTNTAAHKTQLCWCINSGCVGVQNMAVLVYKNSCIAAFSSINRPVFVEAAAECSARKRPNLVPEGSCFIA